MLHRTKSGRTVADSKLITCQEVGDRIDEPLKVTLAKLGWIAGDLARDLMKWRAARENAKCL